MKCALVSDIHSNRQAWQAVEADIARVGVDFVVCLGDVVGYGPAPAETLDSIRKRVGYCIIGNHDAVVANMFDIDLFNEDAREMITWTAKQLGPDGEAYFRTLTHVVEVEESDGAPGFVGVHGSLDEPEQFHYICDPQDARYTWELATAPVVFVGHTHVARADILRPGGETVAVPPTRLEIEPGCRYVLNTGSVGFSREDDFSASYCIFDTDKRLVLWRRVPFDLEAYKEDVRRRIGSTPFGLRLVGWLKDRQFGKAAPDRDFISERKLVLRQRGDLPAAKPPSGRRIRVSRGAASSSRQWNVDEDRPVQTDTTAARAGVASTAPLPARTRGRGARLWLLLLAVLIAAAGFGAALFARQSRREKARVPAPAPTVLKPTVLPPLPPPVKPPKPPVPPPPAPVKPPPAPAKPLPVVSLDPASMPVAGCVLWLRADAGIETAGSMTMRWLDQSGRSNHLHVAGWLPTVVTGAVGGKPVMRFEGLVAGMTTEGEVHDWPSDQCSMFLVSKTSEDGQNSVVLMDNKQVRIDLPWRKPAGQPGVRWQWGELPEDDVATADNEHVRDYAIWLFLAEDVFGRVDDRSEIWCSGEQVGNRNAAAAVSSTGAVLEVAAKDWRDKDQPRQWHGDIAEFIVFPRALTLDEQWRVGRYLSERYGIKMVPDSPRGRPRALPPQAHFPFGGG